MDGDNNGGVELVNICAPKNAPKGAPLIFDPDVPGHCRWGSENVAQMIIERETAQIPPEMSDAIVTMAGTITELQAKIAELETIIAEISKVEIWKPKDAA